MMNDYNNDDLTHDTGDLSPEEVTRWLSEGAASLAEVGTLVPLRQLVLEYVRLCERERRVQAEKEAVYQRLRQAVWPDGADGLG